MAVIEEKGIVSIINFLNAMDKTNSWQEDQYWMTAENRYPYLIRCVFSDIAISWRQGGGSVENADIADNCYSITLVIFNIVFSGAQLSQLVWIQRFGD